MNCFVTRGGGGGTKLHLCFAIGSHSLDLNKTWHGHATWPQKQACDFFIYISQIQDGRIFLIAQKYVLGSYFWGSHTKSGLKSISMFYRPSTITRFGYFSLYLIYFIIESFLVILVLTQNISPRSILMLASSNGAYMITMWFSTKFIFIILIFFIFHKLRGGSNYQNPVFWAFWNPKPPINWSKMNKSNSKTKVYEGSPIDDAFQNWWLYYQNWERIYILRDFWWEGAFFWY